MKKIKDQKGITLMTLVITIIILIILSGIAITSGSNVIEKSKLTAFTTELQIVQKKVEELNQKKNLGDGTININGKDILIDSLGISITETEQEQTAFQEAGISSEGFRRYLPETLEQLGIEQISQEYLVNVDTEEVISLYGIKYDGQKYYTLDRLPNGLYTVK